LPTNFQARDAFITAHGKEEKMNENKSGPISRVLHLYLPGLLAAGLSAGVAGDPGKGEEAITFEANSGETTGAYAGTFPVPEFRGDPASKSISLRYVRFPSTAEKPGNPIVYLSGGPGGSGIDTAKWRRYPLFLAMAGHADVIALDQRGTGQSDTPPECRSSQLAPSTDPVSDEAFAELHRAAIRECATFWSEQGTDLRGYTTHESAQDLSALREHLGAEKISLWGISYGSHLALAAMKAIPGEIDKVIIASVEGLDQTVKLPSRTDAYFEQLGVTLGEADLSGLIRAVHSKLDEEPVSLVLEMGDRGEVPYLLQRRDMQMMASSAIADPEWAKQMMALYKAAHAGDYEPVRQLIARFVYPDLPIVLRAMPTAMDRASGITRSRLARVEKEAENSLLGLYLNFPMPQALPELEHIDLGDDFRAKPASDIPTLVLTGSLDGRTYPVSQREATSELTNATHITVEGAGHNLFMASPEVGEMMARFLAGQSVTTAIIEVPVQ
jgi:pimeloyl-ACP methyl ester carboxylesterase